MIKLDLCGIPCPQPVIETKKAFEKYPASIIQVLVNDEAARVNVSRFAGSRGYSVSEKTEEEVTLITLTPEKVSETRQEKKPEQTPAGDTLFLLTSYGIGSPSEELGSLLMKTFFQTIPQVEPLPDGIVLMNGSVKHAVEGSDTLEIIKKLEALGIDIIVCGTCLDFFNIKNKLSVGRISNFFEIASILSASEKTVTI
ncbi:MAG: sulfurtransferase-like selenium metabolism protein YedF [Elusimicrobia bacterium]|nr:sulfurtransferase-like selenium metabolism protein YedF [Elusimicrobiota bacterium]